MYIICRDARTDHLESLQEMILTDKKSDDHGSHDNGEDDDGDGEQPVALLGECNIQVHLDHYRMATIVPQIPNLVICNVIS